jgi:hypothetical protein
VKGGTDAFLDAPILVDRDYRRDFGFLGDRRIGCLDCQSTLHYFSGSICHFVDHGPEAAGGLNEE